MSTTSRSSPQPLGMEELHSGDRMTRREFHRLYLRAPRDVKAELIGGTVFLASRLPASHGNTLVRLGSLLSIYEGNTRGVEAANHTTILLGDHSEPQPDLYLRILPEHGGQSNNERDDFVFGSPELIAGLDSPEHAAFIEKLNQNSAT